MNRPYDEARYAGSSVLGRRAFFKDPELSYYTAIEGNLYQYQVAGTESLYLDVSSLPESVMNMGRSFIILPDMVAGRPLVPVVNPYFDPKSGERIIDWDKGSYSQGKEANAGFEIIARVQVGPVEYVLGERGGKFPGFTTWERTPANDGEGPPNYYWGRFFENREQAVRNFYQRAIEKFKVLHPDHKPSIKAQLAAAAKPVPGDKHITKAKNQQER